MSSLAVFASVEQMLASASDRTAVTKTADSLSGSPFERVIINGESYLVKYVGQESGLAGPGAG